MFNTDDTNSTLFLMPVFGVSDAVLKQVGFVNAYMADKDRCYNTEEILVYALFRPGNNLAILQQEIGKLELMGMVFDEYDYEGGYVVVVLRFPDKYAGDYDLFLKGKYTKMSKEYKALFPDTRTKVAHGVPVQIYSLHYHIFNKSPGLKSYIEEELDIEIEDDDNFEYWTIPIMEKETLNIESYASKV